MIARGFNRGFIALLLGLHSGSVWAQDDAPAGEAAEPAAAAADERSSPAGDADADASEQASAETESAEPSAAQEQSPSAAQPDQPAAEPAAAPLRDATDDDRLRTLQNLVRRYEEELYDAQEQIRLVAERKYKTRRSKIESNYEDSLDPVIESERRERISAIEAFERFLRRHPNNPQYTPDAVFRLAELHFERYDDEYQQEMKAFQDAYAKWQDGDMKSDPPKEPEQHYERTIALYQRLITDFPEYRLLDGAYYLLGYLLTQQDERDEGIRAWQALVERFPESRFFAEVWFRIGDLHFEEEEWTDAIAAFKNVVPLTDSSVYDDGLYKLAWTYYLTNEFDLAVEHFFQLLDYSYAKRAEEGTETGSSVEEEALQYVAISFTDDNWQRPNKYKKLLAGDSLEDEFAEFDTDYVGFAQDYLRKGEEDRPYERDVLWHLGDMLFKQSKNMQAVKALRAALQLQPLHKEAPRLQDLIVQAFERERMFDEASAERDLLVKNYSPGTEWAAKHEGDSGTLRAAADLARVSLYKAAIYYHQQASAYFEAEKQDLAVRFFEAASQAYLDYLKQYPHDKEAYELSFYLAETYYYSIRFREAADAYRGVFNSTRGTKYRKDAALAMVYSLEKLMTQSIAEGILPDRDLFSAKAEAPNEGADGEGNDPDQKTAQTKLREKEEIDDLRKEFVAAIDTFLELEPNHESAANFSYTAGAVYFAFGHFDEAVRRFEDLIAKYPKQEAARFAANYILNFLLAKQDWRTAAEYAARFQKEMGGDNEAFAKIEGGAKFQIAKKTLEDGQQALDEGRITDALGLFESGANQYLALVKEDPKREFADAMVFNAALFLEKARRPARAAELYERLYREYPQSRFAAQAMFSVAAKSEQAFNFDKAIQTYLKLVDAYPDSDRRADAQINAALALEGQQRYEDAAREFERFATLFEERPEAPEVFFRSALVQKRRGDPIAEIKTLNRFIDRYQGSSEQAARVVEAYARIGEIELEAMKNISNRRKRKAALVKATTALNQAVEAQKKAPDSTTAAYFGGKAAFMLAEMDYADYTEMAIEGTSGKKQVKELTAKTKRLGEVEQVFKSVITTYKQAEWSLASLFRLGSLYDDLQRKLFSAPCPKDIARIDEFACDEYRLALEDKAMAVEEKAVEAFQVAYARAKELKLQNEWTQKTLAALNRLRAADYPIDKVPLSKEGTGGNYPIEFVLPNGGAQLLQALPSARNGVPDANEKPNEPPSGNAVDEAAANSNETVTPSAAAETGDAGAEAPTTGATDGNNSDSADVAPVDPPADDGGEAVSTTDAQAAETEAASTSEGAEASPAVQANSEDSSASETESEEASFEEADK